MGQSRAIGSGAIAAKYITPGQLKSLTSLRAQIDVYFDRMTMELNNALGTDAVAKSLIDQSQGTTKKYFDMLDNDVLGASTITIESSTYFDAATEAIDQTYQLYDKELELLANMLQTNIDSTQQTRIEIVLAVVFLLLLASYGFVAFYYSVADAVTRLQSAAKSVANGDLQIRSDIRTHDEMRELGDNFNTMVDNLRDLMIQVRTNSEQVAVASDEISASTEEIAQGSTYQAENSQEMSEIFAQLLEAISASAQNAEEAANFPAKPCRLPCKAAKRFTVPSRV